MAGFGVEKFADVQGRMKALAVGEPLLGLDRVQSRLDRGWEEYRMAELALAAIDAVALRMGIEGGADPEEIEDVLAAFAALQCPDRTESEHRAVADWIIQRLINPEDRDRAFHAQVGDAEGGWEVRRFSFQLLRDVQDAEGKAVLEASDAAINVLVHALDVDIASEQVAAEAKLRVLLKRGDITQARKAAKNAGYHSQRYLKRVQAQLDAAKRDVASINWEKDVAAVTQDALVHLRERIEEEHALLELARTLQESPLNDEQRGDLEELMNVLSGCERNHLELSSLIGRVGEEIRVQISRQAFAPPDLRGSVHIASQLLDPVLELSLDVGTGLLEGFFERVMGPTRPSVFYLPDVLSRLAELPEDSVEVGPAEVEPIGDGPASQPPPVFTPIQESAVRAVIESAGEGGSRLSAMLERIRAIAATESLPANTDQLLALRALQLFAAPEDGGDAGAIAARRDGMELNDIRFGGDDVLVTVLGALEPDGVPMQRSAPSTESIEEDA
jgi:hypothetical protein